MEGKSEEKNKVFLKIPSTIANIRQTMVFGKNRKKEKIPKTLDYREVIENK